MHPDQCLSTGELAALSWSHLSFGRRITYSFLPVCVSLLCPRSLLFFFFFPHLMTVLWLSGLSPSFLNTAFSRISLPVVPGRAPPPFSVLMWRCLIHALLMYLSLAKSLVYSG